MTYPYLDLVSDLMAYEAGELPEDKTIKMFQRLIDSGLAWTLQGHYGRQADDFIEAGKCTKRKTQ